MPQHSTPRRSIALAGAAVAAVATALGGVAGPAGATPLPDALPLRAPLSPWLAQHWSGLSALAPTTVLVHGADVATARSAAQVSGLVVRESFDRIGVVVAAGLPAQ